MVQIWIAEVVWLSIVFLLGICIGSLINVCVARLPMEKSILWPSSRCFNCLQPILKKDNLPLLGYLRLRGRCRTCGSQFSSRYFWVELITGVAFAGLFWLDLHANWQESKYIQSIANQVQFGVIPAKAWIYFLHHAVFFCFLLVAALTDLDGKVIPLSVTIPGTLVGIASGTFLGWMWPEDPYQFQQQFQELARLGWHHPDAVGLIPRGVYPWPVWGPLPAWLPLNSVQMGFVTALAGAAAGTFMTRAIKFLFEKGMGREALGLGDADLMMVAGAFMGWQPTVIGFFVGTFATLFVAVPIVVFTGRRYSPFGPGLAVGFLITLFTWKWIGPELQMMLFDPFMMGTVVLIFGVGAFLASFILRLLPAPPDAGPSGGSE